MLCFVRYHHQPAVAKPGDPFQVTVDTPPFLIAREKIGLAIIFEEIIPLPTI